MSIEVMSLEEMRNYQGTNPRPGDFDSFWEEETEQLNIWDPQPSLVASSVRFLSAECFDLYFRGTDHAKIHAKYIRPREYKGRLPVIFLFHGYTGDSGDWWDKLSWVQQGFAVAALDCRGQAGLSQDLGQVNGTTYLGHIVRGLMDGPKQLLYRKIFVDTALLVKVVKSMPEIDSCRMAVHGGSQGGALSLVCAALVPEIKKAAVLYPFLSDYKRVYDLNCAGSAYQELTPFFRAHDPLHEKEFEFFERLGYIDVQNFTPHIRADVLWAAALRDEACPPSTQFAAYNHLTSSKEMVLYPDFGHEGLPGYMDRCFQFMEELL